MLTRHQFLTVLVLTVVAAVSGAAYLWRYCQPRKVHLAGQIVSIDSAQRRGVLQIIHPKSGEPVQIEGALAQDCKIIVNKKNAEISDLQPGQHVQADGLLYRWGTITATQIELSTSEHFSAASMGANTP